MGGKGEQMKKNKEIQQKETMPLEVEEFFIQDRLVSKLADWKTRRSDAKLSEKIIGELCAVLNDFNKKTAEELKDDAWMNLQHKLQKYDEKMKQT